MEGQHNLYFELLMGTCYETGLRDVLKLDLHSRARWTFLHGDNVPAKERRALLLHTATLTSTAMPQKDGK